MPARHANGGRFILAFVLLILLVAPVAFASSHSSPGLTDLHEVKIVVGLLPPTQTLDPRAYKNRIKSHVFTVLQSILPLIKIAAVSTASMQVIVGMDRNPTTNEFSGMVQIVVWRPMTIVTGAKGRGTVFTSFSTFTTLKYGDEGTVQHLLNELLIQFAAAWHKGNPSEVK